MKITKEMVEEVIEESNKYPQQHFGLKVGAEWPQFVTELLQSKKVAQELFMAYMMVMLAGGETAKKMAQAKMEPGEDIFVTIASEPIVYEAPLKYLYWGIQIGRQMAEIERLEGMAQTSKEPA